MAELTRPQIKESEVKAVIGVKEGTGTLARGQKEETVTREVYEGLNRMGKEKGYHAVLEKWGEGKVDDAKIKEDIEERVGGKGKTGKPIKRAREVAGEIGAAEAMSRHLLDVPLSEIKKGSLEERMLIEAGKTALEGFPEGKFLLDSYAADPDGLNLLIWDSLKNLDETGEVRASILKRYQEVHGGERRVSLEESRAQGRAQRAQEQLALNKAKAEQNEADFMVAQTELDTFNVGEPNEVKLTAANTAVNTFLLATEKAIGKSPAELENIFATRHTLEARINNLRTLVNTARTAKSPQIKTYENMLMTAQENHNIALAFGGEYDTIAAPRNVLQAQKDAATGKVADVTAKGRELGAEKTALETALHEARADVDIARLGASDEYAKDSQNLLADAILGLYKERYETALASEAKVIELAIEAETDPAAKAIMEQILDGRWRRIDVGKKVISKIPGVRHGKNLGHGEIERFDRGRIRTDIFLLRQEDGDKKVAMEMLKQLKDSAGNPLYGTWDASGKNVVHSAADMEKINDILSSDKFKNEIIPLIRTDVVARAIQTGELTVKDTEFIKKIYGDAAYNDAEAKHAKFIEGEKKRRGFRGKTKDFIKAHPQLTGAIILTLAAPQLMTLGWMAYGAYKLYPRKGHGEYGKPAVKRRMTDAEQEEEEKKRREPINFEEEAKKKAEEARKAAEEEARRAAPGA